MLRNGWKHAFVGILASSVLVLILGACGGDDANDTGNERDATSVGSDIPDLATRASDESESNGSGPDIEGVCARISLEELATIVGRGIAEITELEQPDGVACDFEIEPDTEGPPVGGVISVRIYNEGAETVIDSVQSAFTYEDVSGIGDAAFRLTVSPGAFYVGVDDVAFYVLDATAARSFEPPAGWDAELATLVVDALQ